MFNTDAIIQELLRQGKTIEDARCGGASGCVEAGAFGKENYCLTGYFNLPKVLEITLHNGVDPRTGKKIGIETGDPRSFESYGELFDAFKAQIRHFIQIKLKGNDAIEQLYASRLPAVFPSVLISDCIQKGKDYHAGGARYNTSYIQGVGLGTITDCLASLKHNVFDQRVCTMGEMLESLDSNFTDSEMFRYQLLNKTPKCGNDDDYADSLMRDVFEAYFEDIDGRPNTKGGTYRINLLPTTVHVYFGSVIGALPDGRRAGEPLSEGVSPVARRRSQRPHGGYEVRREDRPRSNRRNGLEPKVHPRVFKHRGGDCQVAATCARLFPNGRASRSIQRGRRGNAARRSKTS